MKELSKEEIKKLPDLAKVTVTYPGIENRDIDLFTKWFQGDLYGIVEEDPHSEIIYEIYRNSTLVPVQVSLLALPVIEYKEPDVLLLAISIPDTEKSVDKIISWYPENIKHLKEKPSLLGWFVGQVMKDTRGMANPKRVEQLLKEKLEL